MKEIITVVLVLVLIFVLIRVVSYLLATYLRRGSESFDSDMREFVPVGYPRYGLRGDLLYRSPIALNYIRPDQNVMLSQSGGEMWVSEFEPVQDGKKCNTVACPGWYDKLDRCWQCDTKQVTFKIPDIAPHVPY